MLVVVTFFDVDALLSEGSLVTHQITSFIFTNKIFHPWKKCSERGFMIYSSLKNVITISRGGAYEMRRDMLRAEQTF